MLSGKFSRVVAREELYSLLPLSWFMSLESRFWSGTWMAEAGDCVVIASVVKLYSHVNLPALVNSLDDRREIPFLKAHVHDTRW